MADGSSGVDPAGFTPSSYVRLSSSAPPATSAELAENEQLSVSSQETNVFSNLRFKGILLLAMGKPGTNAGVGVQIII